MGRYFSEVQSFVLANTSTRNKHSPQIICLIREESEKNVTCFPSKPCSENRILQIIPTASNPLRTSTDEVGRKGRRGKRALEQMQRRSLSETTEKYISRCFLPVSQHINRCCLGTSQHLMQTTSELNLCKFKKKKVCFHVLVSPYLVSGLLFKSTLSNCVDFSWRFFCLLVCFGEEGVVISQRMGDK